MPRVSSKGQVTIPKRVRDELGLKPGDELELFFVGDQLYIAKAGTAASRGLEPWKPEPKKPPRTMTSEELLEIIALAPDFDDPDPE